MTTILTDEVLASIPAMIDEGKKAKQIARELGVTHGTLKVQCSKNGIRLRKRLQPNRPQILTADVMETIPLLVEQGWKGKEIAAHFGCTPMTLQVQCSKRGISLRKGGKRPPPATIKIRETRLTLSQEAAAALQARAWSRGMAEETLASALIEVIVQDDLFAAVLDLEPETA